MREPETCHFCARKGHCKREAKWEPHFDCDFIPYHGILADFQIKELISAGIIEAGMDKVQPTSVDLHLSDIFFDEATPEPRDEIVVKASGDHVGWVKGFRDSIMLEPGQPCLASVREVSTLPSWLTMELRMTSTEGRDCIQHILAVWGDPGFHGRMTLELQNVSQHHVILLSAGDRICQAIFHKHMPVDHKYEGRYKGDMTTQAAKSQK